MKLLNHSRQQTGASRIEPFIPVPLRSALVICGSAAGHETMPESIVK